MDRISSLADEPVSVCIGSWGRVCLDRVRSLADGSVAVWTGSGHWLVGPCLFEPGSDRWLVQTLRVDSLFHVCID